MMFNRKDREEVLGRIQNQITHLTQMIVSSYFRYYHRDLGTISRWVVEAKYLNILKAEVDRREVGDRGRVE